MNNETIVDDIILDSSESNISSIVSENEVTDYLETIIEYQEKHNTLLAQNNINQLFTIGVTSALLVLSLLYLAIKKFI